MSTLRTYPSVGLRLFLASLVVAPTPGSEATAPTLPQITPQITQAQLNAPTNVPANRKFYVTGSGASSTLQAQINAACATVGGDAYVILPDAHVAWGAISWPDNADPSRRVVVCNQRWFDGTQQYEVETRPPIEVDGLGRWKVPDWVPQITTSQANSVQSNAIIMGLGVKRNFWVIGVDIRTRRDLNLYTPELVILGQGGDGSPANLTNQPRDIFFTHFYFGGHDFDMAGNWHVGLNRGFNVAGLGFYAGAYWNTQHGCLGGSDAGMFNGFYGMGAYRYAYGATDRGGGIPIFHGGGYGVPTIMPVAADITVDHNYMACAPRYRNSGGMLDASGNPCPWSGKNPIEMKTGLRWLIERNVITGYTTGGNAYVHPDVITLKGGHQAATVFLTQGTTDVTVRYNLLLDNYGGIATSASEMYANDLQGQTPLIPLCRVAIHDNRVELRDDAARGIMIGRGNDFGSGREALLAAEGGRGVGDYLLRRNHIATMPGAAANRGLATHNGEPSFSRPVVVEGCVLTGSFLYPVIGISNTGFGLNAAFPASTYAGGAFIRKNALVRGQSPGFSQDTNYPDQLYVSNDTDLKVTRQSLGRWTLGADSPLRNALGPGIHAWPDEALLQSILTKVSGGAL
jgi:hypothetical protein